MRIFDRKPGRRGGAWLGITVFLLCFLAGCGPVKDTPGNVDDGKLKVAATLFPYYDFTRQIAGDAVDLSMVVPAGMDSHSFEPTPADIRLLENADLLICNGGAMEHWVDQVLDSLNNDHLTVVTMMDYVDVVEEEIVEGMEADGEEHHHGEEVHGGEDGKAEDSVEDEAAFEIEYDEHIWTSPVNARKICQVIADTLTALDAENSGRYEAAAEDYMGKLAALDGEFRQVVSGADTDLLIMADKFPLRYFADTYGLRYRAAFTGCAADTEPSAKTIAYLIDKVREENLPAVYYLELSSHRVAEIIHEETGAKPLLFHSCHNVTRREFESGVTYLQLMEANVKNLREGLWK